MSELVLSLFPGIGLLDMAFEGQGFCVVRGPDTLWGGDVKKFHPPAGAFGGVIGGPPCQLFSPLSNICRARYGDESLSENLIPEFERCVSEARPRWFLMENVEAAPLPVVDGYKVHSVLLNNRWCDAGDGFGAEQNRVRRISFGTAQGLELPIQPAALFSPRWEAAVCANVGGRRAKPIMGEDGKPVGNQSKARLGLRRKTVEGAARLQGLPEDFLADAPFTTQAKLKVIGNGVPRPMGDAIAKAVRCALDAVNKERAA